MLKSTTDGKRWRHAGRPEPSRYSATRVRRTHKEVFDLRPAAIIRDLQLLRPIYQQTAAYGHFGRELPDLRTAF